MKKDKAKDKQSKYIKVRKLILLTFIISGIMLNGCASTIPKEAAAVDTNNAQQDQTSNTSENQGTTISPINKEENLAAIEYPNLNSESNQIVALQLKEGWTATRLTWKKPEGFDYNSPKNKSLTESYEYNIYNEKGEEIGWFGMIGRYDDKDSTCLPNHLQYSDMRYKGQTKLGQGKIYLLGLDLPMSERTAERDSYQEWYAIIPINNEDLAYNFYLKTPENENVNMTLEVMEDIIVTSDDIEAQVQELFQGEKTTSQNTEKIIDLLTYVNWSRYAQKDFDGFFKIMSWLGNLKINDKNQMSKILNATNGLDGAYTDAYCSTVKDLFFSNKDMFVKALGVIDDEQLSVIASHIHYACDLDELEEVKSFFGNLSESSNNVPAEADKAKKFLKTLEKSL